MYLAYLHLGVSLKWSMAWVRRDFPPPIWYQTHALIPIATPITTWLMLWAPKYTLDNGTITTTKTAINTPILLFHWPPQY